MSLTIKLIGNVRIERDGAALGIVTSPKKVALISYLLLTGQTHSREFIADLLWDGPSTKKGMSNLRQLLSRTRAVVPEIKTSPAGLAFRMARGGNADIYELRANLQAENPEALDENLRKYTGDLLQDFYLRDAPRFNEWLLIEREKLRRQVVGGYKKLCERYIDAQKWVQGAAAAQRWRALDQLDEEALEMTMRFLASNGQIERALQQYESARQLLLAELDLTPSPEIEELAEKLNQLKDEKTRAISWHTILTTQQELPPPDELSAPGLLAPHSVLPFLKNARFVGRRETLLALARLFFHHEQGYENIVRIAAITGMGGIGKTQLAVEFAHRYGRYFPGGVYWMSFAEAENVGNEIIGLGGEQGLGVFRDTENLSGKDKSGRVIRALQEPVARLLIFDNCEDEHLLAKWAPVTGGCRVLVTSRRVEWAEELNVNTQPLPVLDPEESEDYLQNIVPRLSPGEALEIGKELGHLPLALQLVGNFLKKYTNIGPSDYISQLKNVHLLSHPSLKGHGTSYSPTGHDLDVARMFAVNFQQLDPTDETDAAALHFLACGTHFAPGELIPRDLFLVCGIATQNDIASFLKAEDGLERLASFGLIQIEGRKYVSIHRLLISFAEVSLSEAQLLKAQTLVERAVWDMIWPTLEQESFLGKLPFSANHLGTMVEAARGRRDVMAARLAYAWGRYHQDNRLSPVARTYLELSLSIFEEQSPREYVEEANVLMPLGTLAWNEGSDEEAAEIYQRAHDIYVKNLDAGHIKIARAHNNLGLIYSRVGSYSEAKSHFNRSLAIIEGRQDIASHDSSRVIFNSGILNSRMGDYAAAEVQYKKVIKIQEQIHSPDHPRFDDAINILGKLYLTIGRYDDGYPYLERSLETRKKIYPPGHAWIANALLSFGHISAEVGKYAEGLAHLETSLALRQKRDGPDHFRTAIAYTTLGYIQHLVGQNRTAHDTLECARAIFQTQQVDTRNHALVLAYLGDALISLGDLETARLHLQNAFEIRQRIDGMKHMRMGITRVVMGTLEEATGHPEEALAHYQAAHDIFEGVVAPTHRYYVRAENALERA